MGKQERYSKQSVVVISGRRVYGISRSRNGERPGNGTACQTGRKTEKTYPYAAGGRNNAGIVFRVQKRNRERKTRFAEQTAGAGCGNGSERKSGRSGEKAEDFLPAKMDFTDHRIDRDVIGQFVGTIVPVTETCFNWYMNFGLADKSDDMKKLVWEFTIDYKEAKSYRKERDGMLRQNQWHDLTVRVFM